MKIMAKAKLISDSIAGGDGALANRIQEQAVAAILEGRNGGHAWETYMRNFCSNNAQLRRLKGQDDFINHKYGKLILAYFPGDGNCGGGTTTRVGRNMIDLMKSLLDDVDSTTEPEFADQFKEKLLEFRAF